MNKYYIPHVRIEIDGHLAPEDVTVNLARAIVARENAEVKYLRSLSRLGYGDLDPFGN